MRWLLAAIVILPFGCSHAPPKETAPPPRAAAPPPEPAKEESADDEIKVSGTLGTLSDEEIGGPFQRRWDEITACYNDAKAKLWYVGGKVDLKVRVAKTGDVKAAYITTSTFGNYEAERCILAITRDLRFSRPHGGNEAEFTYPIEFRAKAAIQTWDEARVAPALKKPKPRKDVSDCKQKLAARLPASLSMTLYVAPGGKVTSAGFSADAPIDDGFATCLEGKTKLWKLDDPLGRIAKCTVGVD
jgi:TonB family protein